MTPSIGRRSFAGDEARRRLGQVVRVGGTIGRERASRGDKEKQHLTVKLVKGSATPERARRGKSTSAGRQQ
jgi:hypothetical protein